MRKNPSAKNAKLSKRWVGVWLALLGSAALLPGQQASEQPQTDPSLNARPAAGALEKGRAPQGGGRALLAQTVAGVDATSEATVNVTLPAGFRLFGRVQGSFRGVPTLFARGGDGSLFVSTLSSEGNRYAVIVPPGTYQLGACVEPQSGLAQGRIDLPFSDAGAVQILADTPRDLTLTPEATFPISGAVLGLDSISYLSSAAVVFTSGDGRAGGTFLLDSDGRYQGRLASGTYHASLTGQVEFSPTQRHTLRIYDIGSVGVSEAAVTSNFSRPGIARLSGAISGIGALGRFSGITVTARDASAPTHTGNEIRCGVLPDAGYVLTGPPAGAYQMFLANSRKYQLLVSAALLEGEKPAGTLEFPHPLLEVSPAGDAIRTFDAQLPPRRVVISGRITDPAGQGVANTAIVASSRTLSGTTACFSTSSQADADGNYRVSVLKGLDYKIQFIPPAPNP